MTIDEKIEQLRQDWQNQPAKRSIIEIQAKILKTAKTHAKPFVAAYHKDENWQLPKSFVNQVKEALL